MKATFKQVIATVAFAAIGPVAFAQEATLGTWKDVVPSMSRDQVANELAAARKDGSIKSVSSTYDFVGRTPATKSREQVRAELAAARESGEQAALNAESHPIPSLPSVTVHAKTGSQSAQ